MSPEEEVAEVKAGSNDNDDDDNGMRSASIPHGNGFTHEHVEGHS